MSIFPEESQVVEGKTVKQHWEFYTINVLLLETMTHEQFASEFPEAMKILTKLSERMGRLGAS